MSAHLISFENANMMKVYKEIRKELEVYDKKNNLGDSTQRTLAGKKKIFALFFFKLGHSFLLLFVGFLFLYPMIFAYSVQNFGLINILISNMTLESNLY